MSELTPGSFRGASISLMAITTAIAAARTTFTVHKGVGAHWDDLWLALGYVLFMVVAGAYVSTTDLLLRVDGVFEGRTGPYPGLAEDVFNMKKMFFFTSPGLWFTLWSVKFSLLALYKRLLIQVPLYTRIWWGVVVLCVLPVSDWFRQGGCGSDNTRLARVNVWQAYSVDVATDLAVMLLPVGLIHNLQMPVGRKLGLGLLFCLGTFCIIAATLRVVRLGKASANGPSPAWLALWGTIESAIAVIVGCGPGLYRKARAINKSSQAPSHGFEGEFKAKIGNSYERSLWGPSTGGIPLTTYTVTSTSATRTADAGESEEELVGQQTGGSITVMRSISPP